MTVAAIVVPTDRDEALADTAGRAAVRRIVDAAWAGGAMPIVVIAEDADGAVSQVLAGSPAVLVDASGEGEAADYRSGISAALEAVRETSAVLLWPGRMTWVDPETVTSLIERHGRDGDTSARATHDGAAGWPVLVPTERIDALLGEAVGALDDAIAASIPGAASLELGDPGSVQGQETTIDALPAYTGPPEPVGGPPPEWGAAAADTPDPETDD